MNKKIFSTLLLVLVLSVTCSCNNIFHSSDKETTDCSETGMTNEEFYDLEQTNKPTYEQVMSIKHGMTIVEVFDIIGRPHTSAPTGTASLQWYTQEGYTFYIMVWINESAPSNIELNNLIMEYGFVGSTHISQNPEIEETTT